MDKSKKSVSISIPVTSDDSAESITSELAVHSKAITQLRAELHNLFTGCSPLENTRVSHYLEHAEGSDRMLLDAWAKCGRNDHRRTVDIRLTEVAKRTMTSLGLACLVAYARAWLDESEARELELRAKASSCCHRPSGGSQASHAAESNRRPARPTGERKSRRARAKGERRPGPRGRGTGRT